MKQFRMEVTEFFLPLVAIHCQCYYFIYYKVTHGLVSNCCNESNVIMIMSDGSGIMYSQKHCSELDSVQ